MALAHRRVLQHVIDRLAAAPAEGVQAGVYDEPAGPHGIGREHAHPVEWGGVQAHLGRESLGVQAPALAVGGDERPLAELRNRGQLAGDCQLQVVARDPLVIGGRLDLIAAPSGRLTRVHEEDTAAAAVERR